MQSQAKTNKNRILFFLRQAARDSQYTPQKDKDNSKIVVKADKMINYSDANNYFNDQYGQDNKHTLRRQLDKKECVYRSLQEKAGVTHRDKNKNQDKPNIQVVKSQIKRHRHLDTIDEGYSQKNKLYQIPINSNKLKEKYDKNVVSYVKFANGSDQSPSASTVSHNFNTYFEFKQFMSKISNESQQTKANQSKYLNMGIIMKHNKKCSIMPALKPSHYKTKNNNQSNRSNSKIDQYQEYIQTKRTKVRLEQSLMVESKKQELVTHIVARYHSKKVKDEEEGERAFNQQELPDTTVKPDKEPLSPKNNQTQRSRQKNISFYFNGYNQEGVYQQKIRSYRQFLFMVNLAHKVFDPLVILDGTVIKLEKTPILRPTYYVGPGNNAMLVRSIMKRRVWWDQVKDYKNANFVWTQLKIPSIYSQQKSYQPTTNQKTESQQLEVNCQTTKVEATISPQRTFKRQIKSKDQMSVDKLLIAAQKCSYSIVESKKQVNTSNVPKGLMFKAPFAVTAEEKILTSDDSKYYRRMIGKGSKGDIDCFETRIRYLPKDYLNLRTFDDSLQVHNHFQYNHSLGNKKALFYHMQFYYKLTNKSITKAFPRTYHIKIGENDPQFKKFIQEYQRIAKFEKHLRNIWILKPGENSNRGTGITVIKQINELKKLVRNRENHRNGEKKTFILQKYIQKPLLYRGRKFDLRHYMIISGIHGRIRAYWYGEGYIRTSSYMFNLDETNDPMIHLTNDAIQKECEDYGCYEEGNKISYNQLQKYFSKEFPEKKFDFSVIFAKMRELATDAVHSTYVSLDPNARLHNFEVFGLDFMIDDNLDVMLIEVNTNPCLQLSSTLLSRIIPLMLDQSLRVALDPLFPPQVHYSNNTRHMAPDCTLQKFQMELIFDSVRDGQSLTNLYKQHEDEYRQMMSLLEGSEKELDEVFENQGSQIEIETLIV